MRRASLPVLTVLLSFLLAPTVGRGQSDVPLDPAAFLGHPLGQEFTPAHRILDYAEHMAETSPRVRLEEIGRTVEGRPLVLLAITSEENQSRLEELRLGHLIASPDAAPEPLVVWLGFGVHGNESSSPEAALGLLWELASERGDPPIDLDRTVVLLDPLSNPDGRERYVGAFRARSGRRANPEPLAAEHAEPWPGGRTNHYLFDLNRDWAWLTQEESRARLTALRRWEPHVVVDLHEMSSTSEYFFPPGADPVHPGISPEILRWQEVFGRANAASFDDRDWSYFVREKYDLFYPGYGDSYPSLRGAVGMTYEVSGGGRAGIVSAAPGALSLAERLTRHLTAARTTLATAVREREDLVRSIRTLRADSPHEGALLWSAAAPESRALAELLRRHGLVVESLAEPTRLKVRPLGADETERRDLPAGTWLVDLAQPLAPLALGLLDPAVAVPQDFLASQRRRVAARRDAEFYDLTAWALPLAWNLEVLRSDDRPSSTPAPPSGPAGLIGEGELGAVLAPGGLRTWRVVTHLLRDAVDVRRALRPLHLDGRPFPEGSFWIRFTDPGDAERLDAAVRESDLSARRIAAGFPDRGTGLDASDLVSLRRPRIGILGGEGVSPTSFGALWHFLDMQVDLSPSRLDLAVLEESDLHRFDVLLFPDGSEWTEILEKDRLTAAEQWVRQGGTAILVGRAGDPWREGDLGGFEVVSPDDGTELPDIEGAIVATRFSEGSPLGRGLPGPPPALVRGSTLLAPSGDPRRDLLTVRSDDPVLAGVVWPESLPGLRGALLVGSKPLGEGQLIVFAENPAFRGFWRGTMPLLLEGILLPPSLDED